jgi:hypothetical protein
LAYCRQKPGSAARASVNPGTRNADKKNAAIDGSLFAISLLPRMIRLPPPTLASPTGRHKAQPESHSLDAPICSPLPTSFCICETASHRTLKARWPPSLFLSREATASHAAISCGRQMFLNCDAAPLHLQNNRMHHCRKRRIRQNETAFVRCANTVAHRCGQPCPGRMIARAPQDGRMARRCYSWCTGLLSAVRMRIAK